MRLRAEQTLKRKHSKDGRQRMDETPLDRYLDLYEEQAFSYAGFWRVPKDEEKTDESEDA